MTSQTNLTEQDSASFGPRDMKAPGDPAWCWQTVSALQTMWKAIDLDLDVYLRTWADAEEHLVWEKIPYENPYGTKEAMLSDLQLGDDARARARVADNAITAIPLRPKPGQPQKNYAGQHNSFAPKTGSQNTKYLSARIARDRPDVWERMKRGEFPSVAAAAREAGINVPKPTRVHVNGDVHALARKIQEILGPEEFARFAESVSCLAADNEVGNG